MNRLLALAFCVPFALSSFAVAQEKKQPTPAPATQPAKKDEAKKEEKKAEQPKKEEGKKEEKKADAPKKDEKKAEPAPEMMEDKPGEMHKWIEAQAGEWQASSVEFGPDGKPGKPEKGTMKSKMEFGGRFLHNDFNGRSAGQFFHGEGFLGYSNANKRFEMVWVDTNMTSVLVLTGQVDAAKKVLTLIGDFPIPGPKAQFKIVSTILSKDSMKDEMYMVMGGKDTKMMEVTYTKGAASGESKGEGKAEHKEEKGDAKEPKKNEKK